MGEPGREAGVRELVWGAGLGEQVLGSRCGGAGVGE